MVCGPGACSEPVRGGTLWLRARVPGHASSISPLVRSVMEAVKETACAANREFEIETALREAVVANGYDLGAAFDGDADRVFLIDEKGNFVGGDMLTAMVATRMLERHPGAAVVYNLINSRGVPEAILAKAFRGELVPQDPNDEPASVLLDRIRAERSRQAAGGGPAGKPRRSTPARRHG